MPSADDAAAEKRRGWVEQLAALEERAPEWMRDLASPALHIGGYTQVQLETPVLDVAAVEAGAAASATAFFLAACLCRGVLVARVVCGSAERGRELAGSSRRLLGRAAQRVDAENVALMRYFDVYLRPPEDIGAATGERIARVLQRTLPGALRAEPEITPG